MQGTIAKLTVVAAVVGIGLLTLLQVNGLIQQSQTEAPAGDEATDPLAETSDLDNELFGDDAEGSRETASLSPPPQDRSEPDDDEWPDDLVNPDDETDESRAITDAGSTDNSDDIFSQYDSAQQSAGKKSKTPSVNRADTDDEQFFSFEESEAAENAPVSFNSSADAEMEEFSTAEVESDAVDVDSNVAQDDSTTDEPLESVELDVDNESEESAVVTAELTDNAVTEKRGVPAKKRPAVDEGLIEIDPETGEEIQPVSNEVNDDTGPELLATGPAEEIAAEEISPESALTPAAGEGSEDADAPTFETTSDEPADDFATEPNKLAVDQTAQPLPAAGERELPMPRRAPGRSRPGKVRVVNEDADPFEAEDFSSPKPRSDASPIIESSEPDLILPEPQAKTAEIGETVEDDSSQELIIGDAESERGGEPSSFGESSELPTYSEPPTEEITGEPQPATPLQQFPRNQQPSLSSESPSRGNGEPVERVTPNGDVLLPPETIRSKGTDASSPPPPRSTGLNGDATVDETVPQGVLRPHLTIEKIAPKNAVLGRPMVYQIVVKNQGDAAAHQVVVEDRIPRGSQLDGTDPQAVLTDRKLVWDLGTLAAGEERKIAVRVVPTSEGSIGSVATVNFVAEITAETMITAPKLELELSGPQSVDVGQTVELHFRLTNMGNSAADGVFIREVIPAGFEHPSGDDLEYEVGGLPAGESREIDLRLRAVKPGSYVNRAVATAEGGWEVESKIDIDIVGPQLKITREGPSRRTVGRPATYSNTVQNESAQAVRDVSIEEALPEGMEFVEASDGGQYNAEQRVVIWRLNELPAGGEHTVNVVLTPRSRGSMESTVRVIDSRGIPVQVQSTTDVVGYASLSIDSSALEGPIKVGEDVALRVQIRNRGTAPATNIDVRVHVPSGLEFVTSRGLTQDNAAESQVQFVPIEKLAPDANLEFELVFRSLEPGDSRVKIDVTTDQMQRPLSREEAVVIFSDEK